MNQEKIFQLFAGASQAIKQSGEIIASNGADFIENKVIKGNYVTRAEYNQLRQVVLKLEQEILSLKSKQN